jgi:uncharacterized protein
VSQPLLPLTPPQAALAAPREHEPRLRGGACRTCTQRWFPPSVGCPACGSAEVEAVPLADRGLLYSYSTVHLGEQAPYSIGYIDLPGGVRVFGRLSPESGDRLAPGVPVRLALDADSDDAEGHSWALAGAES